MLKPLTVTLHGERPMSWNVYYSGKHWSKRKAEAERVHMLVRSEIDPTWPIFDCPVEIEVRAYFKNRPQDASNICAKFYEDGLIGWLIEDDSPEFVRAVKTVSLIDKDNPRIEIEIKPDDNST